MKSIAYNKLVRDRIPEIIEASGKTCTTEILSPEDFLRKMDRHMASVLCKSAPKELLLRDAVRRAGYAAADCVCSHIRPEND
jgi:hypothetical protein